MGSKKRDEAAEVVDHVSELSDNRSTGYEAELFSNPVGFIPRFPPPPKYIKVKSQNRRTRDFDRLFLAQILLGDDKPTRNRKSSIDSKIHSINDVPAVQPPSSGRPATKAVWALEFSKDGRYLAAAGQDKKLRVWEVISSPEERAKDDLESGIEDDVDNVRLNAPVFKQKLVREYDGHTASILDLSWSKNNFLLSSSMDKTVRLYHVSRDECLCAFKHNDFVTSIQFHPRDDRFFLAGSLDSKIRLWSIPDKSVAYWQQVSDMVTAVAFTPDGKTSIAGTLNGLCILYDTEGLKAHSQIHVKSARGKNSKGSKVTGIDTIAVQRENGDSDVKLLITSNDSRIRMYNLKDRMLETKFRGNENACSQIHASFSDDGRFVICGSEDRKVYIWPTGPIERQDSDKRPVEVFEAHSSIVTSAVIASTRTRRTLAASADPLFDLCNPPPVTLVSRADSIVSSKEQAAASIHSTEGRPLDNTDPPRRAPETPAYLSRHAHPAGHIIVTADYSGQIKVFRHDCAFQKRRQESWDASSTFSKKMLARSGSVTTRNSVGSSVHRRSINLGTGNNASTSTTATSPPPTNVTSGNRSTDRILNWRNSISGSVGGSTTGLLSASPSEKNLKRASFVAAAATVGDDRSSARSVSPASAKSKWTHRLSLRSSSKQQPSSSVLAMSTSPPSPTSNHAARNGSQHITPPRPSHHQTQQQQQQQPEIEISSPASDSFHSAASPQQQSRHSHGYDYGHHGRSDSFGQHGRHEGTFGPSQGQGQSSRHNSTPKSAGNDFESEGEEEGTLPHRLPSNPTAGDLPHAGNDLFLLGEGQMSMMAWNVQRSLAPMATRELRTPGISLGGGGSAGEQEGRNPISRQGSVVSVLSSEVSAEGGRSRSLSRRETKAEGLRDEGSVRGDVSVRDARSGERGGGERSGQRGDGGHGDRGGRSGERVSGRGSVSARANGDNDERSAEEESNADADLKCANCGGTTFKATLADHGHRLRCRRCGTVL
jgi:WD repeat-containing protein 44